MTGAYLDNGATTKVDPEVAEVMEKCLERFYGNPSSLHSRGREARVVVENSRKIIADKLGVPAEGIVFTSGGTESNNLAIKGAARAYERRAGRKGQIITTKIEHKSVLETCEALAEEGFEILYLGVDQNGFVNPEDVKENITENTFLISMMTANNEVGTIQPTKKISAICREKGVLFHTDAVQAFTKEKIPEADLITLSAHKLHGPKGVGALYVKPGTGIRRILDGGAQESSLRPGTLNVPGIVGFGKAVELANHSHAEKMAKLRDELAKKLMRIEGYTLNGPEMGESRLCNNINARFDGVDGESLMKHLDSSGVQVSLGAACSDQVMKPSHVLAAIGLSEEEARSSIRITLSRFTTAEEIIYAAEAISEVIAALRVLDKVEVAA